MWSEPHAREELPQQPVVRLVELRRMCLAAPLCPDCRSTSDERRARPHTGTRRGDVVAVADRQKRDQRELGARPFEDDSRRGTGAKQPHRRQEFLRDDDEEQRESIGCKQRSIGSGRRRSNDDEHKRSSGFQHGQPLRRRNECSHRPLGNCGRRRR